MDIREHMTVAELEIVDQFLAKNGGDEGMKKVSTRELRDNLSEVLMRTAFGKEGTVVTHHRREMCAIVPVEISDIIKNAKKRASKMAV